MKRLWLLVMLLTTPVYAAPEAGSPGSPDWVMPRHDRNLTNRSPLRGHIKVAPGELWRLDTRVTQAQVQVVAGGPSTSSVALENGNQSPVAQPAPRVLDVAGNGQPVPVTGGYWAKLLPNVPGLQRVAWTSTWGDTPSRIQCFSYAGGLDHPRLEWETELINTVYSPQIMIGDVNGDGLPEVVSALHYRVIIFDGQTGKTLHLIKYHHLRNYGFAGFFFEPGDPNAKFVTISDFVNHFDVINFDGSEMQVAFRRDTEGTVAGGIERHKKIIRVGPNPLLDIDADGHPEMTFNLFNDTGDGHWHLMSWEPLTGNVKLDLKDQFLVGLFDVDACGTPELFCQEVHNRQLTGFSNLHIYRLRHGKLTSVYSATAARFATVDLRWLPLTADTGAAMGKETVAAGALGPRGEPGFVVLRPDAQLKPAVAEALCWPNGGFVPAWRVTAPAGAEIEVRHVQGSEVVQELPAGTPAPAILGITASAPAPVLSAQSAQAKLLAWQKAAPLGPCPIVFNAGRRRFMANEGSDGMIRLYEFVKPKAPPELRWARPGRGMVTGMEIDGGLAAGDLTGRGESVLVFAGEDRATGAATLQAVKLDGSLLWQHVFAGYDSVRGQWNTSAFCMWTLGHFTDSKRLDVYATARRSTMHSDESFMLDGRTGDLIWTADTVPMQGHAWGFGGKPVAAVDLAHTGLQQVVSLYPVVFYVADGRDGHFYRIVDLADGSLGGWAAYGIPVVADFLGNGAPQVLVPSPWTYALLTPEGKDIWHNGTGVVAPNWPGVEGPAMGNFRGDGKLQAVRLLKVPDKEGNVGLQALDGATGKTIGPPLAMPAAHFWGDAVADVDGDGADELLLMPESNVLGAYNLTGGQLHEVWRVKLKSDPLHTVVVDPDGTGTATILVGCRDGSIVALGP